MGTDHEDVEADLPEGTATCSSSAVELTRTDVSEIMTPRSAIVSLPRRSRPDSRRRPSARPAAAGSPSSARTATTSSGSYTPRTSAPDDRGRRPRLGRPRQALVRPAFCVPETKNAFELIEEFRTHRTQMAIVLDEYGASPGLITLEDLLEELVGPIDDEHDVPAAAGPDRRWAAHAIEVDATLLDSTSSTSASACTCRPTTTFRPSAAWPSTPSGRLPEHGATLSHDGIEFTILEVREHSIRRVLIDLQPVSQETSQNL